jgi:hypothetical protein
MESYIDKKISNFQALDMKLLRSTVGITVEDKIRNEIS